MSEMKKVKVPEGMLRAVRVARDGVSHATVEDFLEYLLIAALRWLSENPIAPTDEQWKAIPDCPRGISDGECERHLVVEWQRRMFLAEDENPPELSDLTVRTYSKTNPDTLTMSCDQINFRIREAYRRGKESK